MRKLITYLFILLIFSLQSVFAANKLAYDQFRDLLLQANVEEIIGRVDQSKSKIKDLSSDSLYLYLISLVVVGDLEAVRTNLDFAYKRGHKNEVDEIHKHLKFFAQDINFDDIELTQSEKAIVGLIPLLQKYLVDLELYKIQNDLKTNSVELAKLSPDLLLQRKQIMELINNINNPVPYCPSKIDFLLELKDSEANLLIEKEALRVIESKKQILFQNSMDFYELASAHKALAINHVHNGKLDEAKRYIQIAREYIYKMRSIWVIEDIVIKRPIWKIDKRMTRFGFLAPQWLILLREEYDGFLIS